MRHPILTALAVATVGPVVAAAGSVALGIVIAAPAAAAEPPCQFALSGRTVTVLGGADAYEGEHVTVAAPHERHHARLDSGDYADVHLVHRTAHRQLRVTVGAERCTFTTI